jgi:hypothetical protein
VKGLDYVAISPTIRKDPKIGAIALALGRESRWIAGCFPEFFGMVAEHAPDGSLGAIADATLDEWAGEVQGFGAQVRKHLCGEDGVLTAWWRYNGSALAKLEADRARKRNSRGHSGDGDGKGRGKSEDRPTDNNGNVRAASDGYTDTDTGTSSPSEKITTSPRAALARLRELLPETCYEALQRVLIASYRGADGAVGSMLQMLDPNDGTTGPGGSPVTPIELATALQQLDGMKDPGWNGGNYVRKVIQTMRAAGGATGSTGTAPATEDGDAVLKRARELKEREKAAGYAA